MRFLILLLSAFTVSAQMSPEFIASLKPAVSGGESGNTFITSYTPTSQANNYTGDIGFYTKALTNTVVTHLGRWVYAGDGGTHTLKIKGHNCDTLASVSVNCSGAPSGAYVWGQLSSTFTLTNGFYYYVTSAETSGGDKWNNLDGTASHTTVAGIVKATYGSCSETASTNNSYGPVNFKYQ